MQQGQAKAGMNVGNLQIIPCEIVMICPVCGKPMALKWIDKTTKRFRCFSCGNIIINEYGDRQGNNSESKETNTIIEEIQEQGQTKGTEEAEVLVQESRESNEKTEKKDLLHKPEQINIEELLLNNVEPEKRRRGRPRKTEEKEDKEEKTGVVSEGEDIEEPVKRRRGRPRKNGEIEEKTNETPDATVEETTKRRRGRPRKIVGDEDNTNEVPKAVLEETIN